MHAEFVDRYATAAVTRSVSTESTWPMSRDQAAFAEFSTHGCTATSPNAVAYSAVSAGYASRSVPYLRASTLTPGDRW